MTEVKQHVKEQMKIILKSIYREKIASEMVFVSLFREGKAQNCGAAALQTPCGFLPDSWSSRIESIPLAKFIFGKNSDNRL